MGQLTVVRKGMNPFKAKAAASTAFGVAKPKVLSEAEAARRGLPPALKPKPAVQGFGKADRDRKGGAATGAKWGALLHTGIEGAALAVPGRAAAMRRNPAATARALGIGYGTDTAVGAGIGALIGKKPKQPVSKSHGVGRHLTRDQNSTPGSAVIRTPSLREINGKFAGMGYGVKHFTPMAGTVRGAVHTKSVFRGEKKPTLIGKAAEEPRKGMLGAYDLGAMQAHAGSRVGRRIPK